MVAEPILTAAETRTAEASSGVPVTELMERAGVAVADLAWRIGGGRETLILCGPGNNGGDGYVAARLLAARGVAVRVAAEGPPRSEAAQAAAQGWTGAVEALGEMQAAPVLIDGLYGTGLSRPLASATAQQLVRLVSAAQTTIAVDLPSGIASDIEMPLGAVPQFDLTLALGVRKAAHQLLPAAALCGRVVVADLGLALPDAAALTLIGRPQLRAPGPKDNKYTRGKLVVVGGAMPGAAMLAAMAGQRAGAGYVELLGGVMGPPHALVTRAWSGAALTDKRIGAVVIGPGLGRDAEADARLDAALESGHRLVIDADALAIVGKRRLAGHILTPHAGEFARLFGAIGADRIAAVRAAAARSGAIVLLKGADSVVAHPDGRAAIAPLAPAWLASAGTGDVLAGIIGALLAQGMAPFDAVQAGVWLHGVAARRAGAGLIADDLILHLPATVAACL